MNKRKLHIRLKSNNKRLDCDWTGCHKKAPHMLYIEDDRKYFCDNHFIQASQALEASYAPIHA